MKRSVQRCFLFLLLLVILPDKQVFGQTELRIAATTKTSLEIESPAKAEKNYKRKNVHIVTTDIRNIDYGNLCVTEETKRMGFEYTPMPVSAIERRSRLYYFVHNQFVRFKVTLKNGPFWQRKLKKRTEKCRQTTSDFAE